MTRTRGTAAEKPLRQTYSARQPGRKLRPWHKDGRIIDRMQRVEEMHITGKSNRAIARELGVDERTVRTDLQRLQQVWEERLGQRVVELRARCVAMLDGIYRQAMQNAERDRQYEAYVLFGIVPDDTDAATLAPRDGRQSFKGDKAQSLDTARQAIMDQA